MNLIVADRVKELTTTEGSGDFVLSGALIGYRSFASVCSTAGDSFYYSVHAVGASGEPIGQWECGFGQFNEDGSIARLRIVASSSGGIVDFAAGSKHIFITAGSEQIAYIGEVADDVGAINLTYYVRKDGNDSNSGLADTADGAFLTIGKALDVATSRKVYGIGATNLAIDINIGVGTYTEDISVAFIPHSLPVRLRGTGVDDVVVVGETQSFFVYAVPGTFGKWLDISHLTMDCTNGGLNVSDVDVYISSVKFTASNGEHIHAYKSKITLGLITLAGGATTNHLCLTYGAKGVFESEYTLVGNPAFGDAFVSANRGSYVLLDGGGFVGTATGKKYKVNSLSCIEMLGGTFPGDAPGEATYGGQYIP